MLAAAAAVLPLLWWRLRRADVMVLEQSPMVLPSHHPAATPAISAGVIPSAATTHRAAHWRLLAEDVPPSLQAVVAQVVHAAAAASQLAAAGVSARIAVTANISTTVPARIVLLSSGSEARVLSAR